MARRDDASVNQLSDWNLAPKLWPVRRFLNAPGILRQSHITPILLWVTWGWGCRQLGPAQHMRSTPSRVAALFNEGPIAFKADFAEVSRGIKASLRGEGPVFISQGKCARVLCLRHLPCPVERTQRISTGRLNLARRTRLRISNVEGQRRGNSRDTKVIPGSARKSELIHDRSVLQGNGNCVIRDFHRVVGNLQKPEKPIRCDSWIEIVQLGRQTDVP